MHGQKFSNASRYQILNLRAKDPQINQLMSEHYTADKTFERKDHLTKGEYENCSFNNCNFADINFTQFKFTGCSFNACNLSMAKVDKTAFHEVAFKDCKMLGLRFDLCNDFGLSFSFEACQLNHSSFYKAKIKRTLFRNSQLQEVDFAQTDLTEALFDNCNLSGAVFDGTLLEKADLRTSYNYSINPEINRIKRAKFSLSGLPGLLENYKIDIER